MRIKEQKQKAELGKAQKKTKRRSEIISDVGKQKIQLLTIPSSYHKDSTPNIEIILVKDDSSLNIDQDIKLETEKRYSLKTPDLNIGGLSNLIEANNEESNQDEVLDSDSVESHHKTNSISSRKEHFPCDSLAKRKMTEDIFTINSHNNILFESKETKNPSPTSSNKIYESKIKKSEYGLSNYANKLDYSRHKRTVSENDNLALLKYMKNDDLKYSAQEYDKNKEADYQKISKFYSNEMHKSSVDMIRESCTMPSISLFSNHQIPSKPESIHERESAYNDSLRVQKFPMSKVSIKFNTIGEFDNESPNNISPTGQIKTPLPTSTCSKRLNYAKGSLNFARSVDESEEIKYRRESSKDEIIGKSSERASNSSERVYFPTRHEKFSKSTPNSIFAERSYQHMRIIDSPTYSEEDKQRLLTQIKELKKTLNEKECINTTLLAEISQLKNENNDLRCFVNYIINSHFQI